MQVSETLAEGLKREFKIVIGAADIGLKIEDRLVEVGRQARLAFEAVAISAISNFKSQPAPNVITK